MKKLLAILALFSAMSVSAQTNGCGMSPIPPLGFYYICVCDQWGHNCRNIAVKQ